MSEGGRKISIDFKKCIKAGECYYNHPDLFGAGESGFPMLKRRQADSASDVREAGEAIEVCPSGAITLS